MVKLRVRVGPKGQIVIPKALRDAYNIREGGEIIIEPRDDGILIRKKMDPEEVIDWLRLRKYRIKVASGKLGELENASLEWEFEDE